MSVFQAFLCGVVYFLAIGNLPFVGLWSLQRPLVCGLITGIILGDPLTGAMTGASINLVYLGFISAGGSMPADMALAGILGTAFAITGGLDAKTALSVAVPIGLLGTIVWYGRMTFGSIFVHVADNYIENGEYNKIWRANVLFPQLLTAVITIIPCGLAAYFGASYISGFIELPHRHQAAAGSADQDHRGQRRAGGSGHHRGAVPPHQAVRPVRPGADRPQPRALHPHPFPGGVRGPHLREALPRRGVQGAHPVHRGSHQVQGLHPLRPGLPHRRHLRRGARPPYHQPVQVHQVRRVHGSLPL